jgi:hypothetical protein
MAEPTGTHPTSTGEAFPTSSLPGTAHPNPPATDQQGIKGTAPKSQTGTPAASKPPKK